MSNIDKIRWSNLAQYKHRPEGYVPDPTYDVYVYYCEDPVCNLAIPMPKTMTREDVIYTTMEAIKTLDEQIQDLLDNPPAPEAINNPISAAQQLMLDTIQAQGTGLAELLGGIEGMKESIEEVNVCIAKTKIAYCKQNGIGYDNDKGKYYLL